MTKVEESNAMEVCRIHSLAIPALGTAKGSPGAATLSSFAAAPPSCGNAQQSMYDVCMYYEYIAAMVMNTNVFIFEYDSMYCISISKSFSCKFLLKQRKSPKIVLIIHDSSSCLHIHITTAMYSLSV